MTYTYGLAKAYQQQLVRESETGQAEKHLAPPIQGSLRGLIRDSLSPLASLQILRKQAEDAKTAV
jgi:hypothetical protein